MNTIALYVAPRGSDRNPGTKSKPLASLAGARNAVRKIKSLHDPQGGRKNRDADVLVLFRGGTYRLGRTVVFSLADSAAPGRTIIYAAYPRERPIFAPDIPVRGWKRVSGPLPGLPKKARGRVYVASVPEGLKRFFTLYDGPRQLPRARVGPFKRLGPPEGTRMPRYRLRLPRGRLKNWPNLPDVEVRMTLSAPWSANVLPLKAVDEDSSTADVAIPPTYGVNGADFERYQRGSTYVENIFEGLSSPGRWVLDSRKRKVYLWPRRRRPSDSIVAPALTELVRVEGKINYDEPADEPVRGLTFRGLTFTRADRYAWSKDHVGWGLQHDWELFDCPSAMVRFRGAEDCAVESCRLVESGAAAVRLDLHCMRNRVADNVIDRVGGVGVLTAGYGPGSKDVNRCNEIVGNRISRTGREYWHAPGIMVWQSGENRIADNLIHHLYYTGIVVSTRLDISGPAGGGEGCKTVRRHEIGATQAEWPYFTPAQLHTRRNVVERNDIHHVMEWVFDGNGIYMSAAYGDNVVRWNFVHDCPSHHMQAAMRSDQPQDNTHYLGNVIWRCGGAGIGIVPKGANEVVGNIIVANHYDKQEHWAYISLMDPHATQAVLRRNIICAAAADHMAYLPDAAPDGRPVPKLHECNLDYNLYWNTADANWGRRHLEAAQAKGIELHSLATDPQFVDPARGDFRLKPTSPALALGFEQIDQGKIGRAGDGC